MVKYKSYQKVQRLGSESTKDCLNGTIYIFPKIDGTNGVVWFDGEKVRAGSRNRDLSEGEDNYGFRAWVENSNELKRFFSVYPNVILYGEWLVLHTIKNYEDTAWNKFYIFDVFDCETNRYLHYKNYYKTVVTFGLNAIPMLAVAIDANEEDIIKLAKDATFLMKEGFMPEGVVCKNYDSHNQTWHKYVLPHFNNGLTKKQAKKEEKENIELKIVNDLFTPEFIAKEQIKFENQYGKIEGKLIPRFLHEIFNIFVEEEILYIMKKYKFPTINFKNLNDKTNKAVKNFLEL